MEIKAWAVGTEPSVCHHGSEWGFSGRSKGRPVMGAGRAHPLLSPAVLLMFLNTTFLNTISPPTHTPLEWWPWLALGSFLHCGPSQSLAQLWAQSRILGRS